MAVRSIFKWLVGTVVAIVVISLILEFINISLVGGQINQLSKIATRQACVLFGQETYKRADAEKVDLKDIEDSRGMQFISGDIYGVGKDATTIYKDLYNTNEFKAWATSNDIRGRWANLDSLTTALNNSSTSDQLAKSYKDNKMTTLNLGITYLDKSTVEKIMKWNIAAIFSNGEKVNVVSDSSGDYIKYKGFRIYAKEAKLKQIEYKVINIVDNRDEFMDYTGVDSLNLGLDGNTDERANVCIAGITYEVPVAYEGVTPLKQIMEFVWNKRVAGMHGNGSQGSTEINPTDSKVTLTSGGFTGNNSLPVPGSLVFYVMR